MTTLSTKQSELTQFKLGYEYNEKDYEVLRQAAADRRRAKREELRGNIAMFVAGVMSQLKPKK